MTSAVACPRCSEPVGPGSQFCPRCGLDVSGPQGAATTAQLEPASQSSERRQAELLEVLREATLGEYDVIGELGRGGMATVYLAHDIALDRRVAIKVMHPALLLGEGMLDRFRREARTAAALSHPHIIPIHVVRETDEILYFVMKFVQGRALDSIIEEQGPLPIRMVQAVLAQVGGALGYAHRHGVIHRDVKPANIMIDDEGWAVVTDFGIAKVTEARGLTVSGTTIGTPYYMSPEQCESMPLTGASDQYSLGVVAYEMLTGRTPFRGASLMEIMRSHFFETPAPLASVRPDCPPVLAAAIERMLAKRPEDRWPSVEEAVAAIGGEPLGHDDPVRSRMIELARSGEKPVARVSGPVSPTPAGRRSTSKQKAARTAGRAPPTKRRPLVAVGLAVVSLGAGTWVAYRLLGTPGPHPSNTPRPIDSTRSTRTDSERPEPLQSAAAVMRVVIAAHRITLGVGERRRLTARVLDSRDSVVPTVTTKWTSTDDRTVIVDSSGMLTGVRAGVAVVRAWLDGQGDSSIIQVASPVQPPSAQAPSGTGSIWIGTRGLKAVLYVNGLAQGAISRLRRWPVPSGTVRLSIREEGCVPWDSTIAVPADAEVRIGYRYPTCTGS